MNKEYKISELMENYTDNEFFLEGEQTVDTEKAVNDLLAQVRPKKRMKPLFKVIAAAAAAVVLAGAATAGTLVLNGSFKTPTNINVSYKAEGDSCYVHFDSTEETSPIKVEENDRLYFIADGEHTDITDLVDENTPYIYSYVNTEGFTCYIIAGGAAGDYGYFELLPVGDTGTWSASMSNTRASEDSWIELLNGVEYTPEAVDEAFRSVYRTWVLAAFDELGLWSATKAILGG